MIKTNDDYGNYWSSAGRDVLCLSRRISTNHKEVVVNLVEVNWNSGYPIGGNGEADLC